MKVLITGMNGTVAPALAQSLSHSGHTIVVWDRSVVPTDNPQAAREFIRNEQPDWFFHVATGSADWAELVAQICAEEGIKFLFSGSVSVFSSAQRGPFSVDAIPQPDDDYGRYKLECEQRIRAVCPQALIVRLGWQIGETVGRNHMVDYLDRTFKADGHIEASVNWYPSCAFLSDTTNSLVQIMQEYASGLYQLEGNSGLNFYEIAVGLNRLHGNPWVINASTIPVQHNLMADPRVRIVAITHRMEST